MDKQKKLDELRRELTRLLIKLDEDTSLDTSLDMLDEIKTVITQIHELEART